jgi:hypothetical protein
VVLSAAILGGGCLACGQVPGSSSSPTPSAGRPGTSGSPQQPVPLVSSKPPTNARQAVWVQLKLGADPNAVGARVLGPNTFVRSDRRGAANPPLGPAAARIYLIPVPPDQEQAALARARSDPEVERAELVPWPPDFP